MHLLTNYDIYIFDCDGVILDSNQLKIEAMEYTLNKFFSSKSLIEECIVYFKSNFGKSRFHHVDYFLFHIFKIGPDIEVKNNILEEFSKQCRSLYMTAEVTPGFFAFLESCTGKRYVASGSEQEELRDVFDKRDLSKLFDGIYGSPTPKSELVRNILNGENSKKAVIFGDAISDRNAAADNKIDFIYYRPYSTVKNALTKISEEQSYRIIDRW